MPNRRITASGAKLNDMQHLNALLLALPLTVLVGCATSPPSAESNPPGASLEAAQLATGDDAVAAPRPCRSATLFAKDGFLADVSAALGMTLSPEDAWGNVRLGKVFSSTMGYGGENVSVRVGSGSSSLGNIFSTSGTDGVLSFTFGGARSASDQVVATQMFAAMTGVREVREVAGGVTFRTRASAAGRLSCQQVTTSTPVSTQVSCTIRDIFSSRLELLDAGNCASTYL